MHNVLLTALLCAFHSRYILCDPRVRSSASGVVSQSITYCSANWVLFHLSGHLALYLHKSRLPAPSLRPIGRNDNYHGLFIRSRKSNGVPEILGVAEEGEGEV